MVLLSVIETSRAAYHRIGNSDRNDGCAPKCPQEMPRESSWTHRSSGGAPGRERFMDLIELQDYGDDDDGGGDDDGCGVDSNDHALR